MSYRDDLAAAHARIAALEADNAQLRKQLDALRVQPPSDEPYRAELAALQDALVHTIGRVEIARLMRRMGELHEHLGNVEAAGMVRSYADALDPA